MHLRHATADSSSGLLEHCRSIAKYDGIFHAVP
jgi:hypothetical protein